MPVGMDSYTVIVIFAQRRYRAKALHKKPIFTSHTTYICNLFDNFLGSGASFRCTVSPVRRFDFPLWSRISMKNSVMREARDTPYGVLNSFFARADTLLRKIGKPKETAESTFATKNRTRENPSPALICTQTVSSCSPSCAQPPKECACEGGCSSALPRQARHHQCTRALLRA